MTQNYSLEVFYSISKVAEKSHGHKADISLELCEFVVIN